MTAFTKADILTPLQKERKKGRKKKKFCFKEKKKRKKNGKKKKKEKKLANGWFVNGFCGQCPLNLTISWIYMQKIKTNCHVLVSHPRVEREGGWGGKSNQSRLRGYIQSIAPPPLIYCDAGFSLVQKCRSSSYSLNF